MIVILQCLFPFFILFILVEFGVSLTILFCLVTHRYEQDLYAHTCNLIYRKNVMFSFGYIFKFLDQQTITQLMRDKGALCYQVGKICSVCDSSSG